MSDVDEISSLRGHVAHCKVTHARDYADLVQAIERHSEAVQACTMALHGQGLRLSLAEKRLARLELIGVGILLLQVVTMLL